MLFEVEGEEKKRLLVKQSGNGGYTYLPASWIGREIEVILLPEETEEETYIFQRDDFNLPAQISFTDDGEDIEYWNGLEWVEHPGQIQQNESFQEEDVQEDWELFLDDIMSLDDENDNFFQWAYDLSRGESHTFENGVTLFKQF